MQQEHQRGFFMFTDPTLRIWVSHAFTKWGIKISQFYFMVHVKIKRIFLYSPWSMPYKMAYRSIGILKFLLKWLYAQWSDIPFYNLLLLTAFVILKSIKKTHCSVLNRWRFLHRKHVDKLQFFRVKCFNFVWAFFYNFCPLWINTSFEKSCFTVNNCKVFAWLKMLKTIIMPFLWKWI